MTRDEIEFKNTLRRQVANLRKMLKALEEGAELPVRMALVETMMVVPKEVLKWLLESILEAAKDRLKQPSRN